MSACIIEKLSGESQRDYRITWRGDSHVIRARSRSAARYASWKAFLEAGYRADLPTFAGMIQIEACPLPTTPSSTGDGMLSALRGLTPGTEA